MMLDSGTNSLIPLPAFPPGPVGISSHATAGLRRFGLTESDLGLDFSAANRAALVTRLLEQCTVDPDGVLPGGFFRKLSIGNRIECLLALAADVQDAALSLVFNCTLCDEKLELELTLREISELQREADLIETVGVNVEGRRIEFRKPRGSDQEDWAAMVFEDEAATAACMIGTLAVTPDLPTSLGSKTLSFIEDALDEADPLVNFSCRVTCGECGESNEYIVDLLETALEKLNRAQRQMFITVHRLASHYHWSETEIFGVPDWRRQEYLNLIEMTKK